ncbi:MAG: Transcriptional regulator, LysR family [Proteobacteria bacterium]|nr:Transcriptional regulator, LysR family [Pseudomonadota bacterium]
MSLVRRLTLRQLEVFCEAARLLNFARVAEHLHLTQPAVSMLIRQIEASLDLALFERSGKKMRLTEAGETLKHHALRILGELRDADQALNAYKGLEGGSITVGLVSTAQYFAPKLLAQFARQYPGIDVQFQVGNRETLIRLLRDNQTDLVIMGRAPAILETVSEPLAENPHVLVAHPDHPALGRTGLTLRDLQQETFLLREAGSGSRSVMEEFFEAHDFTPARTSTMGSNETIKQAVMAGLGISLLSLHTLALELRGHDLALLEIDGTPLRRTWHIVHMRAKQLSPAGQQFRRFLIEQTEGFLRNHLVLNEDD